LAKVLVIATGFPPFEFSENITNGKLVTALIGNGHEVNIISKIDEGQTYNLEWCEPWLQLEPLTFTITYPVGGSWQRSYEIIRNTIRFGYPLEGIRWAGFAYKKAKELIQEGNIDLILTRSPSDIAHLVGLRLKKKLKVKWIANWNDPSTGTWPDPYERYLPTWKKIISKKYTQEILKFADTTTFPSQMLAANFQAHFKIEESRIAIIPHIMLENQISYDGAAPAIGLHLVHSGNMSIERDPTNLFMALKRINDQSHDKIYLDIMGVISKQASDLLEDLNLKAYIRAIEPMPYYKAMRKMAEYDVLLILEAKLIKGIFFSSKNSDYAQLNKPILAISPQTGEVKRLLEKYGGGFTSDNSKVEDIEDKLLFLNKMKAENRLDEIVINSSLKEYLGENRVVKLLESSF